MKKIIALLLVAVMVLTAFAGCGSDDTGSTPAETSTGTTSGAPAASTGSTTSTGEASEAAAVDPYTGIAYAEDTTYSYLYDSDMSSWNYLSTSMTANQKALSNFVDSLVEYDKYGNIIGCLADSWETSDDGLVWTFHLREDAKWYDFEGNEYAPVVADDFVYAARLVANSDFDSEIPDMLIAYVENGSDLYNKVLDDYSLLGVVAKDEHTLEYHLTSPCAYFLTLLTYGSYFPVNQEFYEAQELEEPIVEIGDDGEEIITSNNFGTDNETILYNGAFICTEWLPQESETWVKNDNYWDASNVFIEKVSGRYNAQAGSIAPEMFLRGEVDSCNVTTNILDDWLNGENATYVHGTKDIGGVMYMLFDFNPHFDDEAAGENYKKAVNNKNFRLSIVSGWDKSYSISAFDPYDPQSHVQNTMVPSNFCGTDGKDYNQFGNLPKLSEGMYDEAKALEYKAAAIEELTAEGVTFPITIPAYYSTEANQDGNFQLIEKHLEEVLGSDYIDIVVYAGPATNFISEIRKPGKYGLYESGWSPDYADPATYFEPFGYGWTWGQQEYIEGDEYKTGYIYTQEDYDNYVIDDEELIGQPQFVFNSLVEAARAETDLEKRYELFAKADEYAITEALVIPYRTFTDGYIASNIAPFETETSQAGICRHKLKFAHLLEKSYSIDEFNAAYALWEAEKNAQ